METVCRSDGPAPCRRSLHYLALSSSCIVLSLVDAPRGRRMRNKTWRPECFAPACVVGGVDIVGSDTC